MQVGILRITRLPGSVLMTKALDVPCSCEPVSAQLSIINEDMQRVSELARSWEQIGVRHRGDSCDPVGSTS